MREVVFIKRNADRWQKLHEALHTGTPLPPDQLYAEFIRSTDDLSYAQTYYPGTKTVEFLNNLAARLYLLVYKNKRETRQDFLQFWKQGLPLLHYRHRLAILLSLLVFLFSVGIGALSSSLDDSFVRLILGDRYVNMTLENINNGDPLAVYKKMNEADMFLGITFNNIRVALYAFASGIFFCFLTAYVLLFNGIMLGSFHELFARHNLLAVSVGTVWLHGTLEISAIIVAGGAGFVLGAGILFPGTYSRFRSFQQGARDAVRMVLGLIPVFVAAGFIESFITRYTGMPDLLKVMIITASLIFVCWYYIYYPYIIHKKTGGA